MFWRIQKLVVVLLVLIYCLISAYFLILTIENKKSFSGKDKEPISEQQKETTSISTEVSLTLIHLISKSNVMTYQRRSPRGGPPLYCSKCDII